MKPVTKLVITAAAVGVSALLSQSCCKYETEEKQSTSIFDKADTNKNGRIDEDEMENYKKAKRRKNIMTAAGIGLGLAVAVPLMIKFGKLSKFNAQLGEDALTMGQYRTLRKNGVLEVASSSGKKTIFADSTGKITKMIRQQRYTRGELISELQKDGSFVHEYSSELFDGTVSLKYFGYDLKLNPIKDAVKKIEIADAYKDGPLVTRLVLDEEMIKRGRSFSSKYYELMGGGSMPSQYSEALSFLSPKGALHSFGGRPIVEWIKHVCS